MLLPRALEPFDGLLPLKATLNFWGRRHFDAPQSAEGRREVGLDVRQPLGAHPRLDQMDRSQPLSQLSYVGGQF